LETLSSLYIRHDGSVPFTGKQSMGGFNLTNVLDPIGNQDAATKKYVDDNKGSNYNASYYLRDASLSLTGQNIFRNVSNSNLNLFGGTTGAGKGGIVSVEGSDSSSNSIVFYVPDATKTTDLIAAKFVGVTSLPYLDMMLTRQIKRLADPTDPQDAATKSYVDALPIYNASYWTGTNYNASYWTGTNYNSSYWTGTNYNSSYDGQSNYNASYITSTFNATYDAKPSSNYNATYDAKWGGTNYNASYLTSTYNATYDAKTNYNASYWTGTNYNSSYWTGTNYNASYITSTYNATYDAKTNYNASYLNKDGTVAMTGNLSMGSKYINNLISGLLGSDAVNKSYVDSIAGNYNATYDAKPSIATIYPVGSIYISTVSTNPNTLFGVGTWAAFGTGRVLVGINASDTNFDVVEEVGGTKTVASAGTVASIAASGDNAVKAGTSASTAAPISHTHAAPAYTGTATSIVQPYIVVYMWERTS